MDLTDNTLDGWMDLTSNTLDNAELLGDMDSIEKILSKCANKAPMPPAVWYGSVSEPYIMSHSPQL